MLFRSILDPEVPFPRLEDLPVDVAPFLDYKAERYPEGFQEEFGDPVIQLLKVQD